MVGKIPVRPIKDKSQQDKMQYKYNVHERMSREKSTAENTAVGDANPSANTI